MKKILVMLSSYCGEKYIREQISSILCQQGVNVTLIVRDDGSTDETCNIIKKFQDQDSRVTLIQGDNIGFRRSFFELVRRASKEYDYYAFSDQDDVWEPDKISRALEYLENVDDEIKLYASGLKVVDEDLNFLYLNSFKKLHITYGSALSRQRLAGCTMVFNSALLDRCQKFEITKEMGNLFSHDAAVYYICLACGGRVLFDPESRIQFRRHSGTVTEHGKGIIKRIQSVLNIFGSFRNRRYEQSNILYCIYKEEMPDDVKNLAEKIASYRKSIRNTISLMVDPRIDCGLWVIDFIDKLAILAHCY